MQFPLELLLEGRGEARGKGRAMPLVIEQGTLIRDALKLMIEHDFSQLPVVDKNGHLTGIISEQSLIRAYYHVSEKISWLDLPVNHAEEPATQLSCGDDVDVFKAMDQLRDTYAIIVVRDRKPVGIITDYDTTQFFRTIAGDLLLVEDIEVTMRHLIQAVLSDDATMTAALFAAFGPDRRDETKPGKLFCRLDFGDHLQLITTARNWPKFSCYFEPKELFCGLMDQVREVRNQLMHFRGRADSVQHDILVRARDWLTTRPTVVAAETLPLLALDTPTVERLRKSGGEKYEPLRRLLTEQAAQRIGAVRLRIADVAAVLGDALPAEAKERPRWWTNDASEDSHSETWLQAGWHIEHVDLTAQEVVFRRTDAASQTPSEARTTVEAR